MNKNKNHIHFLPHEHTLKKDQVFSVWRTKTKEKDSRGLNSYVISEYVMLETTPPIQGKSIIFVSLRYNVILNGFEEW